MNRLKAFHQLSRNLLKLPTCYAKSIESIQPAKSASVQALNRHCLHPKNCCRKQQTSREEANRPGWNCEANKVDENWNCQLVGPSPESKTQIVATEEPMIRLRLQLLTINRNKPLAR